MGINLNYVKDKEHLLTLFRNRDIISPEHLSARIKDLANNCIRRYNYDKIGQFIYRGTKQNHE
jgi:hypothetical protein